MDESLISIVMPVYNVESFIEDAIESVKKQTYRNFECIVVDDGSTDLSVKKIEKSIVDDKRFRLFRKDNGGLSDARNFGLNYVQGEFIYFFDSDDLLSSNFLEVAITGFLNQSIDMVWLGYQDVEEGVSLRDIKDSDVKSMEVLSAQSAIEQLMDGDLYQMAWSYISRTSLIKSNEINFSVDRLFEDNNFAFCSFSKIKQGVKLEFSAPPYYRRVRQGSITTLAYKNHTERELKDELFVFTDSLKFIPDDLREKGDRWYFNKLVHLYSKYRMSLSDKNSVLVDLNETIVSRRKKIHLGAREEVKFLRTQNNFFDKIIRRGYGEI